MRPLGEYPILGDTLMDLEIPGHASGWVGKPMISAITIHLIWLKWEDLGKLALQEE